MFGSLIKSWTPKLMCELLLFVLRPSIFLFPVFVLLITPSHLLAQDIDRTLGLRELRNGCFVYLHTDDRPGVRRDGFT
jgi:hypothetical protein